MRYVRGSPNAVRLDRELLHLPGLEHALELAAQQLRRLAMQDLEDRAADRLFARHALHPGLALAIPRLNAILAVDHVEADRQRVDDLLGESPLLVDLARPRRDLRLEAMGVLGVAERRREQVGDRGEKELVLGGQRPTWPGGEGAELLAAGEQACGDEAVACETVVAAQQLFDGRGRRVVVGDGPGAAKPVEPAQPEAGLAPSSSLATAARIPGMTAPTESPVGERGSDLGDRCQRARESAWKDGAGVERLEEPRTRRLACSRAKGQDDRFRSVRRAG